MALNIKWNDDRIPATISAVLLIVRADLARGVAGDVIERAVRAWRDDPQAIKALYPRRDREAVREPGPLAGTRGAATYQKLNDAADRFLDKLKKSRRRFNSLEELDNFLIFNLRPVLEPENRPMPGGKKGRAE